MLPEEELIRLIKFGTTRKIRDLVNNNSSLDLHYPAKNLSTPLTTALDRSDPIILTILIDKITTDLDATLTQPCGRTSLMYAAYYSKNSEILNVLVKKGADPNKTDINGWNCLFYAVIGKRLQNIDTLLDYVSIESKDSEGRTPLMISVYLSNLEVFDYLLNRGADFEVHDKNGYSALHLAILRRKRECVIELSRRKSDINYPSPFAKVSSQQLIEELMFDILPVRKYVENEL